jgi:hypothetical protein
MRLLKRAAILAIVAALAVLGMTMPASAEVGTEKVYFQGRCGVQEEPEYFQIGGTARFQFDGSPDQYEALEADWMVLSREAGTDGEWVPVRTMTQIADPTNWILSYDATPSIRWQPRFAGEVLHEYRLSLRGRYAVAGQPDVRFRVARIATFDPSRRTHPQRGCQIFEGTRL